MCQSSSCTSASQADFPLFQVELVDSQGVCQDRIGYRFGLEGAAAAADGWNRQTDRTLTAIVRPFDGESENVFDRKLRESQEPADDFGYHVVTLMADNTFLVINDSPADYDWAHEWVKTWHHESARAVIVNSEDLGDVEGLPSLSKCRKASSTTYNARTQDSDSDIESGDVDATSEATEGHFSAELDSMIDDARERAQSGDYTLMASVGMRVMLVRYLQTILDAVKDGKVCCSADLGMLAAGLQRFAVQVIEGHGGPGLYEFQSDEFDLGRTGGYSNNYGTLSAITEWLDMVDASEAAVA